MTAMKNEDAPEDDLDFLKDTDDLSAENYDLDENVSKTSDFDQVEAPEFLLLSNHFHNFFRLPPLFSLHLCPPLLLLSVLFPPFLVSPFIPPPFSLPTFSFLSALLPIPFSLPTSHPPDTDPYLAKCA